MKKHRPVFIFLFLLFFLLPVTGCRKTNSKKIKIGFLLKTMQEERYQRDKSYFIKKAESLGADVIFDSANNDEQSQLAKFENMLSLGCTVIVLQPVNTDTAGNMVKMAHSEGVKVIGYDSMLMNGPLDLMVMQDSWSVGRLQGEAMLDWIRRIRGKIKGNVVLIKGQPGDSNANAMSSGVLEIIRKNPGLKLVAQQSHEAWSPEKAMATAENLMTKYNNNIDAFICNNSGMCRGVIAALDNIGLAHADIIFTAGADADLVNIQFIANKKQTVDVWKKIQPLAEKAAEAAVTIARNPDSDVRDIIRYDKIIYNDFADVPTILTEIVLITRDNIDSTIIAGGFFTRAEIYP